MTTDTTTPAIAVRAQHQAAVAHLAACQARVRELNAALATERYELVEQSRSVKRLRPDGSEAPPGDRSVGGVIVSHDVSGSRVIPNDVDPITRWRARLDLPAALTALRRAEIDEAELRPLVAELDRQDAQRRKLALLPRVRDAYEALDRALVKAASLRGAVVAALQEVGAVSPTDANTMAGLAWPELAELDHRREMVKAWTAQANGSEAST